MEPITIGSLIVALAGTIASQIGSANANKLRQQRLNQQKLEEDAWYNKEYYTDELDRTENKAMLNALSTKMKEQNKRNQNTSAITGATPEMQIAQQDNMNKTYGNVVNEMAGRASMRKDNINAQHRSAKRNLYTLQDNLDNARQQTWANLGANATQLAGVGLMYGAGGKTAPSANNSTAGGSVPDLLNVEDLTGKPQAGNLLNFG